MQHYVLEQEQDRIHYPTQGIYLSQDADYYTPALNQAQTLNGCTFDYDSTGHGFSFSEPGNYAIQMASNTDYGLGPDPIEYPLYAPVPLYPPTLPPILNGADANTPISSYPPNLVEPQPEGFDVMPHMPTGDESTLDGGHGAPDFLMLTGVLTDPSTHSEVSASTEVETAEKAYTTLSSPFSSSKSSKSSALSKSSRVVKAEAREKFENVRKAHFRATSEAVGFEVTDPDTITVHEKKRHYLECLEGYIQWLHHQISLAGYEPAPLERTLEYSNFKNSSVRTILVHMQDKIRTRNDVKLQAEKRFVELRNALLSRNAKGKEIRHSIAVGPIGLPNIPTDLVP